ncbi:hypothetical protein QE152_g30608 [Popillia japonica]|uniref:Uncharacterized protein n=1 Tax=Popillia japonica TaxID=7064 RepID=A0AAW1JE92_POPJA
MRYTAASKHSKIRLCIWRICEYILRRDAAEIMLIPPKSKYGPKEADNRKSAIERVKSGNTRYTDLLRYVKDSVDPDRIGVQVNTVRKRKEGDLLLEVRGERQKASALGGH